MAKVFITGATGFVGAHVARKLVLRGEDVTALIRPQSDLALIRDLQLRTMMGDLRDFRSVLNAMQGAEVVYHVAADYRLWSRNPKEMYATNVYGTRNVMEAAARCGVKRVVYTSTVGCLGIPRDGSPGNETTPVSRHDLPGHYKKSKYDAEMVALDYASNGLDVVIVNPSTPVGPGDTKPTPTGRMILDFMRGRMLGYVDTGLNLIAVEDVADGHLLAMEGGRRGERYILGNRNLKLIEIFGILAKITGRTAPTIRVPYPLALAAAYLDAAWSRLRGSEPTVPIEGVLMSRKRMFFDASKAVSELGLPQSPVEDALRRSVEWFSRKGPAS